MKRCLLFYIVSLLSTFSYAQRADNYYVDVYDNSGKRINANQANINGSPYLYGMWGKGSVTLNNRQQYNDVALQFDIETNTLHFKKDSTAYKFSDKVTSFHIAYPDSLQHRTVYFKSGYPNEQGYPTDFLYQVLAEGKNLSFLKYLRVRTEQHTEFGLEPKQKYVMSEELWLYDAGQKRMLKISKSKNSIEKALPAYIDEVQKFASDKHYKLNSDREIAELITFLNTSAK